MRHYKFNFVQNSIFKKKSLSRFGKNFPWRGRQALCNPNTTKIESETLQKISSAVTVSDFNKLFLQTYNLTSHENHSDSSCISNEKSSYNHPLTCHIKKGVVLSDRKPVTSTDRIANHQHRKGKARYNITTKVGGNESFDDETEWYIELASRCYNDGFQWHMNYLNDCTRRSALLKRRRLTGSVTKSNRITNCGRQSVEHLSQSVGEAVSKTISNDDRFREDIPDCKIRININQSLNSNFSNSKTNHNTNARKRSNYSYVAHLNKKINIMNSSGYSNDAINVQNDIKTDRLNEVLDNFGSLNISCGSILPQIVLTDFSSIDSMPRTNTLLLTPSAEQFNISGTKSTKPQTECLSIPAEYYRNETRPC